MRIGISGAQSTGKTTLFRELQQTGIFKDYIWFESSIRDLAKNYGLTLNEESNDLAQIVITDHLALNAFMYKFIVTDRTPLDSLAYTRALYYEARVCEATYRRCFEVAILAQRLYDVTFYLEPEFPIEAREMRSASPEYQQIICQHFETLAAKNGIKLVYLFGSVEERVEQAMLVLERCQK